MQNTASYHENLLNAAQQTNDALLTRKEAARFLGLCQHTLMSLGKRGAIREIRITRRAVRYRREDLNQFINDMASK